MLSQVGESPKRRSTMRFKAMGRGIPSIHYFFGQAREDRKMKTLKRQDEWCVAHAQLDPLLERS